MPDRLYADEATPLRAVVAIKPDDLRRRQAPDERRREIGNAFNDFFLPLFYASAHRSFP